MDPRATPVDAPVHLQIADDIRLRIERGELAPGDALPTLADLSARWHCSETSARSAITLLKHMGLIRVGRGRPPVVRTPPRRVVRDSSRHQIEKDLALHPEAERGAVGTAEMDMGVPLAALQFSATFSVISMRSDLAEVFGSTGDLLQRVYELTDPASGHRQSWSVSWIPITLIEANPDLMDESTEPWPGGTQHQLSTVGIEIMEVVDEVTAMMPTTAEAKIWGLDDGVPFLRVRRLSCTAAGQVVEISEGDYCADRTTLRFTTPLTKWKV